MIDYIIFAVRVHNISKLRKSVFSLSQILNNSHRPVHWASPLLKNVVISNRHSSSLGVAPTNVLFLANLGIVEDFDRLSLDWYISMNSDLIEYDCVGTLDWMRT
jgi:hypothetical protein